MKWASAISDEPSIERALDDVIDQVRNGMGPVDPDLLLVFLTAQDQGTYRHVSERLNEAFDEALLLGCSAGGVIGGGQEVEQRPALSLTGARLPGVVLRPFHLKDPDVPRGEAHAFWQNRLGLDSGEQPHFILLPDPFTFDPQPMLDSLDQCFPESTKLGGLASGGRYPGSNALFLGESVGTTGVVGVGLSGNIEIDTVVAQGCRPIGSPVFVTGCIPGAVQSLDGKPPAEILAELYECADARDRELFRTALFVGLVMRDDQESYGQGDFLVRNIIGLEARTGLLHVAAELYEGQVIQFHLRDAVASAEDLSFLLTRYAEHTSATPPAGALLFSCLGRGVHLYGVADHDTNAFREIVGDSPLGGFFCNGEIGPVQGTTFIHGYTSSFGLFRSKDVH